MRSEIEENYRENSSKNEQIIPDDKLNDDHAKSDRIEEIRRIVDQVLDELVTKAVDVCNQDIGAGDVDNDREKIKTKKIIENMQYRKRVEGINFDNKFPRMSA